MFDLLGGGLLYLVLAIAMAVHAVQTARPLWWLLIILLLPFGALIYAVAIFAPDILGGARVRRFSGQARAALERKWQECWEAYLCDVKSLYAQHEDDTTDRSRITRPVLYEAVEAIHTNLLNALFPGDERFFSVLGKRERDHQNALVIEELIRVAWGTGEQSLPLPQAINGAVLIGGGATTVGISFLLRLSPTLLNSARR